MKESIGKCKNVRKAANFLVKLVLHNSAMVPLEKLPRFMKNARKFLPRNPDLNANLHMPATTVAGRRMISIVNEAILLDSDMLLDACGLSGLLTIDISQLHRLPAQVAVMGSIKVRLRNVVLTSATRSVPPHSRHNFGLLDSWEGPLREISQGVAHVALQLASGLAVEFGAQHTLPLDTLERVKTSGIPSSFDAYKAMCRATQSRIASERAHFYERAIMLDPGYADAYSSALVRRTRGEACSF